LPLVAADSDVAQIAGTIRQLNTDDETQSGHGDTLLARKADDELPGCFNYL
jgi:hypothetical protein